jgi:hypothetical protein
MSFDRKYVYPVVRCDASPQSLQSTLAAFDEWMGTELILTEGGIQTYSSPSTVCEDFVYFASERGVTVSIDRPKEVK